MKYFLFASVFVGGVFASAQSFDSGLWKSVSTVELNNFSLPEAKSEKCVTTAETKNVRATFEKELKKKDCLITKWIIQGQKLDAALECKGDDIDAQGTFSGDITRKSYNLKGRAEGVYKHIPAVALFELSGQWVKKTCLKK